MLALLYPFYSGFISSNILTISMQKSSRISLGCKNRCSCMINDFGSQTVQQSYKHVVCFYYNNFKTIFFLVLHSTGYTQSFVSSYIDVTIERVQCTWQLPVLSYYAIVHTFVLCTLSWHMFVYVWLPILHVSATSPCILSCKSSLVWSALCDYDIPGVILCKVDSIQGSVGIQQLGL